MGKIVFVILHYCALDTTIRAVECLIKNINYHTYEIVIVDNASPDESGEKLQCKFEKDNRIYFLPSPENRGFASGNNIGYAFAKARLHADFIVIMNNDVMIYQKDFASRIIDIYRQKKYYILGPDVITLSGKHQNPHRLNTFQENDLNRIIRNRTLIISYLTVKKILHLQNVFYPVEKWDQKRAEAERKNVLYQYGQTDVVLHGSILIFSPDFLRKEETAFYPKTFMWMEEEILAYLCKKKGYMMLYEPSLKVIHEEGKSTNYVKKGNEWYFFYSQQLKRSAKIMKELMEKEERNNA